LGWDAARIGWDPAKAAAFRQWRRGNGRAAGAPFEGFGAEGFDFGDLFGDIFGDIFGARRQAGRRRDWPQPGEDVGARIEVDLADVVRGAQRDIVVERPDGRVRLQVRIPPGIADRGKIRLAGQGGPGVNGGPPGDLYLEVRVRP